MSVSLFDHDGYNRMNAVHHAEQVYVKYGVPVLSFRYGERLAETHARIAKYIVDRTPASHVPDVLSDRFFVADVQDLRMDEPVVLPERFRRRGNVLRCPAAHVHLGPAREQTATQAQSDAGGCPGNDRCFPFKKTAVMLYRLSHVRLLDIFISRILQSPGLRRYFVARLNYKKSGCLSKK